jgi:cobalt-zinc-cadmium efflux system protein
MAHLHDHSHHHHDHTPKIDHINTAFIVGIILNSAFVIIEVIAGWVTGSLSLLTDAGHNLSDVASLALALLAFKLARAASNKQYTYGYKRSTIMVSVLNAAILLVGIVIIVYEAIIRLIHPQQLSGETIAWVALIGIAVNAITAWLFTRGKGRDKDLNIRGAYLHMAIDAIVSLGVVISGIIIYFTHLYWIDSVVSIIIAIVIMGGTWGLLKDSLRLEMDGVPKEMNLESIRKEILSVAGILDIHHLHVWALSTTENALTAHVVVNNDSIEAFDQIKHELRHKLEHLEITHCTFEPELSSHQCSLKVC